jgi:hypothetical protein
MFYICFWGKFIPQLMNRKLLSWNVFEKMYLLGFIGVFIMTEILFPLSAKDWPFLNLQKMEFLPLMITSVYSSLGLVHVFVKLCLKVDSKKEKTH